MMMNRIVIIGATSGIGLATARIFHSKGWIVGIAGRRQERLDAIREELGDRLFAKQLDVCQEDAGDRLIELIEECGGTDVVLLASGFGKQNYALNPEIEIKTMQTNVVGFTRVILAAYHYFKAARGGHIAAITSIAGTKGLGASTSYSSTKRMQSTYIQALSQLSRMNQDKVTFTDILPGFVDTDFIKGSGMPFMMSPEKVARKIVKSIEKKKRRVVVDWKYALLVFFWRPLPNCIWERLPIRK